MKKVIFIVTIGAFLYACGGSNPTPATETQSTAAETENSNTSNPNYDPNRGEGKFSAGNVTIGASLDAKMAAEGEKIQEVKCSSCHKHTEEKLVGPGWKGVTERRKPEWIMNFITNPDPMIDKDPAVQAQLEICLVRMPNQGLNDEEARNVLEFMRKNDGVK
ncbi:MAG: c-type cytochrome [Bacteroidota bacterium]